jgi:flagellar hook-associated protein 2
MPTITSTGIGSGLDINSLVSQLVAAERDPADRRLTTADAKLTAQVSAIAALKGALSGLQGTLNGLKASSAFDPRRASVDDESFFTASVTASAAAGHYDVEVVQLATATRLSSAGFPVSGGGADTVIGTGTLAIDVGTETFTVEIDSESSTLAGIRDAINAADGNAGVRATLITDEDGTHLVLTGDRTGADNAVSVNLADSVDDDGNTVDGSGLSQLFGMAPKDPQKDVAQDAIVKVSGFEIHGEDNTIDGAIEGVTLVLRKAHESAATAGLDISRDDSAIQGKAQSFVTAFNALARQFSTLGGYNAATQTGGTLQGDALLLGISAQTRRIITDPVAGTSGDYRTLASLGITTAADGTLQLDAAKFQQALADDPEAVSGIFSGGDGVAVRLGAYVDARLSSAGEIATRSARLTSSQQDLEQQREALDARMELIQQRYLKQFTALDSLLAQLQSTSTYLAQQLDGLSQLANYTTANRR